MKKIEELKAWQLEAILNAYADLQQDQLLAKVPLDRSHLLSEDEACRLLGICQRTLRSYRQQQLLRFVKLNGRVLFMKVHLYEDLIAISNASKKKD